MVFRRVFPENIHKIATNQSATHPCENEISCCLECRLHTGLRKCSHCWINDFEKLRKTEIVWVLYRAVADLANHFGTNINSVNPCLLPGDRRGTSPIKVMTAQSLQRGTHMGHTLVVRRASGLVGVGGKNKARSSVLVSGVFADPECSYGAICSYNVPLHRKSINVY